MTERLPNTHPSDVLLQDFAEAPIGELESIRDPRHQGLVEQMTRTLSLEMEIPEEELGPFLRGEAPVTDALARTFAGRYGTSEQLWHNLQAQYDAEEVRLTRKS